MEELRWEGIDQHRHIEGDELNFLEEAAGSPRDLSWRDPSVLNESRALILGERRGDSKEGDAWKRASSDEELDKKSGPQHISVT